MTPPGVAIAASLVLREWDELLSLRAGLAVADVAGPGAQVKWPNDVWLDGRKVAGMLVETRNGTAGRCSASASTSRSTRRRCRRRWPRSRGRSAARPARSSRRWPSCWRALERRLAAGPRGALADLRERDALLGRRLRYAGGEGVGAGIDESGALLVRGDDGTMVAISTGEVRVI